jgi:CcmD family protein
MTLMPAMFRRITVLVFALMCSGALPMFVACAQEPKQTESQQQDPKQQGEFLPLDQLPPTEQIPAARLLIAAYVVVIVVVFLYLLSVARRLSTVQREVERLEADVKRTGRA